MLVHITPTDLLIMIDWQVIDYIQDNQKGNLYKTWFAPLPGFDEELFPFIVVSGRESINLISLKDKSM